MDYILIIMNIVKTIDQYDENYVFFCDPIKNNVMNEGSFIRIIYSTPNVVLNGVYILITNQIYNLVCLLRGMGVL